MARGAHGRGRRLRSCCGAVLRRLRKYLLLVLIILGVIIGFIIGASVNESVNAIKDPEKKATAVMLIGFPGELFMNMLKLLILPLIVASLITALSTLDSKATGRIGRRTVIYYLGTMLIAVLIGIILVVAIRPGELSRPDNAEENKLLMRPYRNLDSFLDLLRSCFPINIVEATFIQKRTHYKTVPTNIHVYNKTIDVKEIPPNSTMKIFSNGTHNFTTVFEQLAPGSNTVPAGLEIAARNMNVLGLVVFSIVFGIVLGRVGERGLPMKAVFESLNEIVMEMISLVMWISPIGICSLIAAKVAGMSNIGQAFSMLGYLMGTAMVGFFVHGVIVIPLIYFVCTRKNPIIYIKNLSDALATAYGTDSSAATLPTTIKCVEEYNKVDKRISRFVLPLGATVNMDGTALYEGVCALWVAQLHGVSLGPGQVITIVLTAVAAAVGAAAIPSAGLVTMLIVLQAVNLPLEDVALLWAVDWFMDRFRTVVNVLGDAIGAGIVEHLSRDELKEADQAKMEEGEKDGEGTELIKKPDTSRDPDQIVSHI
ncbi:Excitatory amino acid transporter 2 [Desmophyllum pertusum]|uniref:Amino acid transporter n=1 Tax=Desmophyllum pertusum TaxID=174260 RepID=A0A9W9Y9V7_9CNID|nr:Excitatory amino acid transporter 2 [Desmophyllum pertusum]